MSCIERDGDIAVVYLQENLVALTAGSVREELKELVQNGVKTLTIDMGQVEMVDSVGLGLLIAAHNSLPNNGGGLNLRNLNSDLLDLFRTMRLDKHFHIAD